MATDLIAPSTNDKPNWPIRWIPTDQADAPLEDGVGLCVSGGAYRAMLFHVSVIWRLNELGFLDRAKLKRVSSVSGGSLVAGVLAMRWRALGIEDQASVPLDDFNQIVVKPIRDQAHKSIDISNAVSGRFSVG